MARPKTSIVACFACAATCIYYVLFMSPWAPGAEPEVEYARNIKPILSRACTSCHGKDKQRGGLRLDSFENLRLGGDSGPVIVPGQAGGSRLIKAITGTPDVVAMPPKGPRLPDADIALLNGWINQGARARPEELAGEKSPGATDHWAFRPIKRPALPTVKNIDWAQNPIDLFILARLEKEGLEPSPPAEKSILLRRLSLDLIGLSASPGEMDAYVRDNRPDAYERVVERLLDSPHHGERWGRHWLDLARYADSNGYSIDAPRSIWPYRDWVIRSLNDDLPFDRFTIEQLAGDLLPQATLQQKIATGFHRNSQINEEGGIDKEQFRIESVIDRLNTTGAVWLGLTVGCAQCHNHKFDPFSQREYYQLMAFFNNQDEPTLTLGAAAPGETLPRDRKGRPTSAVTTMIMSERVQPRQTRILAGGDFTRPGAVVPPGTPALLPLLAPSGGHDSVNRLDLARWLVSGQNPLTARVVVNRIWAHYFGLGLVETENDFGAQGTPPSHPELLDWLASEFVRQGWSYKSLHRLITTSATYRQASCIRRDLEAADPANRLLGRQKRLRLEAEVVRDVALASSGLLDEHLGGPSIFPPQPEGVDQFTQVKRQWAASDGPSRYRRGLYTYLWRAAPHPALSAFDAPDAGTTCTRRNRSNTPLQALTLLNDAGFVEYAYGLAARIVREGGNSTANQVAQAFRLCLGRHPEKDEAARLTVFVDAQREMFAAHPADAAKLLAAGGPAGKLLFSLRGVTAEQKAALVLLSRVVLNLDEFITRE